MGIFSSCSFQRSPIGILDIMKFLSEIILLWITWKALAKKKKIKKKKEKKEHLWLINSNLKALL